MIGALFTYTTLALYGLIPWLFYKRAGKAAAHVAAVVYLGGVAAAIAVLSVLHYAVLFFTNTYSWVYICMIEALFLLGASLVIWRLRIPDMGRKLGHDLYWLPEQICKSRLGKGGVTFFILALFVLVPLWMWLMPRQQWDIWITWEQHARFIVRDGGVHWRAMFVAIQPGDGWFRHTDYPFLWPLAISRLWVLQGGEWVWTEVGYVWFFALTIGYATVAAVYELTRSIRSSLLALLLLVSQPVALYWMSVRYAEAPLAMYMMLATTLLLHALRAPTAHRSMLGALAIGLAACGLWTKNEGAPFFAAIVLFCVVYLQSARAVMYGVGLCLVFVLSFLAHKSIAPAGDLSVAELILQWPRLFDVSQYQLVGTFVLKHCAIFVLGLLGVSSLMRASIVRKPQPVVTALFGFQFLSYMAVYILTPHGTLWHLNTSYERLWMHLLPLLTVVVASMMHASDSQDTK